MKHRAIEILLGFIRGIGFLLSVVLLPVGLPLFFIGYFTVYPIVYIWKSKDSAEGIVLLLLLPATIPLWLLADNLERKYL